MYDLSDGSLLNPSGKPTQTVTLVSLDVAMSTRARSSWSRRSGMARPCTHKGISHYRECPPYSTYCGCLRALRRAYIRMVTASQCHRYGKRANHHSSEHYDDGKQEQNS
jgi:hypothetical protein